MDLTLTAYRTFRWKMFYSHYILYLWWNMLTDDTLQIISKVKKSFSRSEQILSLDRRIDLFLLTEIQWFMLHEITQIWLQCEARGKQLDKIVSHAFPFPCTYSKVNSSYPKTNCQLPWHFVLFYCQFDLLYLQFDLKLTDFLIKHLRNLFDQILDPFYLIKWK